MKRFTTVIVAILASTAVGCAVEGTAPHAAPNLTIDHLVDIKHPSNPIWSPDGARIAFLWDRAGVSNLYVVDSTGGDPRALTSFR